MEIDLFDFERAMSGDVDMPLLFDLLSTGFRPAEMLSVTQDDAPELDSFGGPTGDEPARDEPACSGTTSGTEESDEVEEIEEDAGELSSESYEDSESENDPLAVPASAGSNLNTPRSEVDMPDYETTGAVVWQIHKAWVGAVKGAKATDTEIWVPTCNAQVVFDSIETALECKNLPATDQLCRILLARILFVWKLSMRIAILRETGRRFSPVFELESQREPTAKWVWSVFGPMDSCDRVDAYASCEVGDKIRVLAIETPAWIWWYINLVFSTNDNGVHPREWTNDEHIAQFAGCIVTKDDEFQNIILANGIAMLHKRHLQTLRNDNFFASQHPVCQLRGLEDIKCLTRASLGGALSSKAGDKRRAVMRDTARLRVESRMRRHVGMFQN